MKKKLCLPILGAILQLASFQSDAQNLIPNGDFSAGYSGFTNQLGVNSSCGTGYVVNYNATDKCNTWANFTDHTGSGKFLAVKGVYNTYFDKQFVWFANSSVNAYTTYTFTFWARKINNSGTVPLEVQINTATNFYTLNVSSVAYGAWTKYAVNWASGSFSGGVTVGIRQKVNGADQEFAIDDISFERVYIDNAPGGYSAAVPWAGPKIHKCSVGYFFKSFTSDMTVAAQKASVHNGFSIWSAATGHTFYEAASEATADIKISFNTFSDGPGYQRASFGFPNTLNFDDAETWVDQYNLTPTSPYTDLVSVAAHEMGHAFGFFHSNSPSELMYDTYNRGTFRTLGTNDLSSAEYYYKVTGPSAICATGVATGYNYITNGASVTWSVTGSLSMIGLNVKQEMLVEKTGNSPNNQVCVTFDGCTRCKTVSTACKIAPDNTTEIETTENNLQTAVYPNPAAQTVVVEIKNNTTANATVSVNDITGKEVIAFSNVAKNANKYTLDVNNLDNGVYFIRIVSETFTETQRIVVNH